MLSLCSLCVKYNASCTAVVNRWTQQQLLMVTAALTQTRRRRRNRSSQPRRPTSGIVSRSESKCRVVRLCLVFFLKVLLHIHYKLCYQMYISPATNGDSCNLSIDKEMFVLRAMAWTPFTNPIKLSTNRNVFSKFKYLHTIKLIIIACGSLISGSCVLVARCDPQLICYQIINIYSLCCDRIVLL